MQGGRVPDPGLRTMLDCKRHSAKRLMKTSHSSYYSNMQSIVCSSEVINGLLCLDS